MIGRCILYQLVIGQVICIWRQYHFDLSVLYKGLSMRMRVALVTPAVCDSEHLTADFHVNNIETSTYSIVVLTLQNAED